MVIDFCFLGVSDVSVKLVFGGVDWLEREKDKTIINIFKASAGLLKSDKNSIAESLIDMENVCCAQAYYAPDII